MSKQYEKPTINKIDFAMASKYGSPVKSQKVRTQIDGVSVNELTSKYGSPLFVFSQKTIEEKYNTSFENSTTSFDVEDADNEYEYLINELEDTDYTIEIDQTLGVKLMPSPTQGVYDSTTFVVHTDDLHNEGDILNVQIDAVLYKGSIQRIIDYEVLEE